MPRVLICVNEANTAGGEGVLVLADQLRHDGIDAVSKHYDPVPADGRLRWLRREMLAADFVLLPFSDELRRGFAGHGPAEDNWIGLLAQQLLFDASTQNHRLIPLLEDSACERDIPIELRAFARYRVPAEYEQLYRHLTGQPEHVPPVLGELRVLPTRAASVAAELEAVQAPVPRLRRSAALTRVLAFAADARCAGGALRLGAELSAIEDGLRRARLRERFELRMVPTATLTRVVNELDEHLPDIVHFGGHGSEDGAIVLEGLPPSYMSPADMAQLFAALSRPPALVVFSLCHSRGLAEAVSEQVCPAIGFDGAVADATAQAFAATLYERLASYEQLDLRRAFSLAQVAAREGGLPGAELARLCTRSGAPGACR